MNNNFNKKGEIKNGMPFLWIGLLCFLIAFLDMPIGYTALKIAGISLSDPITSRTMVVVLGPVIVIWALLSFAMYILSKNKIHFDIFQYKDKPSLINILIVFGILLISMVINYFNWDRQFRPLGEYRMIVGQVGSMAWFIFLLQYIYYIFEMTFVSLGIIFIQEFVKRRFSIDQFPVGGLFAGIIWGFLLHVRQGIVPGLQGLLIGFVLGCIYILMKKNIRYAFPFIYLTFVL